MINYLEKLLDGQKVEWRKLGEVAELSNTGVDKKCKANEQKVRLLNFVDVFQNQYINNHTPTMIVTAPDKKIANCNILKGDVFITPSSEIIDEIGQSAMAVEDFDNAVYSYHIMRLRIFNKELLQPEFLNYLFQSNFLKRQIKLNAQGITRFGLTQPKWKSLQIPIPPLPVQKEIVKILDKMTEIESALEDELTLRLKQYHYYRDKLLSENELAKVGFEWKTLGEAGAFIRGKRFVKADMVEYGEVPCIHYGEMYTYYGVWANQTKSFLTSEVAKDLRFAEKGDIVIVAAGETIEDIGRGTAWLGNERVAIHDACFIFRSEIDNKYLAYFFRTEFFHNQIKKYISSGKISAIHAKGLEKVRIPVPSLSHQAKIVAILDKFDTLTQSISEGLPHEIALRRKQYEYYREQLLSFPKP